MSAFSAQKLPIISYIFIAGFQCFGKLSNTNIMLRTISSVERKMRLWHVILHSSHGSSVAISVAKSTHFCWNFSIWRVDVDETTRNIIYNWWRIFFKTSWYCFGTHCITDNRYFSERNSFPCSPLIEMPCFDPELLTWSSRRPLFSSSWWRTFSRAFSILLFILPFSVSVRLRTMAWKWCIIFKIQFVRFMYWWVIAI